MKTFRSTILFQGGISLLLLASLLCAAPASGAGGTVVAWGDNTYGQTNVPPDLTNAIAIANQGCGYYSLALRADDPFWHNNRIAAWGDNRWGQANPPSLANVVALAGGDRHCLAINADGSITNWGANYYTISPIPAVPSNDTVSLSAGEAQSLALRANGTVVAAGTNEGGGAWLVADGLSNVVATASGGGSAFALKADGTVAWWRAPMIVPPFFTTNLPVPANVTNVVAIATSAYSVYGLALKADGTVVAWSDATFPMQTNVPAGLNNIVAIAAGAHHCLALRADGTVTAWGSSSVQTDVPPGLTNVIAIAAGAYHSLALIGDGPPILQVSLTNSTWDTNGFRVSLPTQSGRVYALEYKDSLADTNWTALPLVAGNGGIKVLTDPTATNSQRFYRVRRW